MRPLPIVATASAACSMPGRASSAREQMACREPCHGHRRAACREMAHLAHRLKALCLAIIRASATVRAPSSMLKPLSWPGLGALQGGLAGRARRLRRQRPADQHLLGGAGAPWPRSKTADGDARRRARCRRPSPAPPPPRRARRRRTPGPGSCDRSRRGPAPSSVRGCAGSIRRAPAWSQCCGVAPGSR